MKRLLVILAAAAAMMWAQDKAEPAPKMVQKIIEVKYGDVTRIANIIGMLGQVRTDTTLRVISIAGSAETVAAMEEAIKKLDVPSAAVVANIDLTVFLVYGSGLEAGADSVPKDLESTVKQLH